MKRFIFLSLLLAALAWTASAEAGIFWRPTTYDVWHGSYYNAEWGVPMALVVPPTARREVNYGWGVGNSRVTRISGQFSPGYGPGSVYDRSQFQPTPARQTDTTQSGYYHVRGPW